MAIADISHGGLQPDPGEGFYVGTERVLCGNGGPMETQLGSQRHRPGSDAIPT